MSGLTFIGQDDFAAGWLTSSARDTQPGVGVAQAVNALFDDDGDAYRRGGTNYASAVADGPMTFVWTGFLADRAVGLVATATSIYTFDPVAAQPYALTKISSVGLPGPVLPAVLGDVVFLPNGFAWGGSTKVAYNAGTIAVTQGQPTIVGTGTTWVGAVEPGMMVTVAGQSYRVTAVVDNTHLTVGSPIRIATASGVAYTIGSVATLALPGTGTRHVAAIANRLVVGYGNHIAFSAIGIPTFDPTDYHQLPDGVTVVGMLGLRDLLMVFTAYGLWSVQNMALDLTDAQGNPQQSLSRLTPELSLLHEAGLCEWAGAIIAPCADRIFLVDGLSAPIPISDSIAPDYMRLIRAGVRPGGAKVYRNHLFLPMLLGLVPQVVLVCRLNRPVRGRQTYYPFSTLAGHAAGMIAGDASMFGTMPRLLVAHTSGRLVGFSNFFNPGASYATDADGTAALFDLETRDFPTGNGQPNHVRRLRLAYTLEGQGSLQAGYSIGQTFQTYKTVKDTGSTYDEVKAEYVNYDQLAHAGVASGWTNPGDPSRVWNVLETVAAPSPGVDPVAWNLNRVARVRWIRARFRCADPVSKLTVHRVEFGVRPSAHQR